MGRHKLGHPAIDLFNCLEVLKGLFCSFTVCLPEVVFAPDDLDPDHTLQGLEVSDEMADDICLKTHHAGIDRPMKGTCHQSRLLGILIHRTVPFMRGDKIENRTKRKQEDNS